MFQGLLPIAKTVGKTAVRASRSKVGKDISRGLKNAALDTAAEIISGEDPGEAITKNLKRNSVVLLKKARKKPQKRKRTPSTPPRKKLRKQRPLFDESDEDD